MSAKTLFQCYWQIKLFISWEILHQITWLLHCQEVKKQEYMKDYIQKFRDLTACAIRRSNQMYQTLKQFFESLYVCGATIKVICKGIQNTGDIECKCRMRDESHCVCASHYCILHPTFPTPLFHTQMHLVFELPNFWSILLNIELYTLLYVILMSDT